MPLKSEDACPEDRGSLLGSIFHVPAHWWDPVDRLEVCRREKATDFFEL
jgi:hypothetical protein